MKFLLDTNVCIGIMRNTLLKTVARVSHTRPGHICLCSIVRFELVFGIERCARPASETTRVEQFWQRFPSFDFDDNCADEAAQIRHYLETNGIKIGAYDTQIAAVARFNNLTLVTRNVREFQRVPNLIVEDWES